jgi:hypothetical protein
MLSPRQSAVPRSDIDEKPIFCSRNFHVAWGGGGPGGQDPQFDRDLR